MTQQTTTEPLLTKQDVIYRARVSMRTLDTWLEEGKLAYLKLGRGVRFYRRDVEEFLKTQKIGR
jgi:excisionase family DNA binding protein